MRIHYANLTTIPFLSTGNFHDKSLYSNSCFRSVKCIFKWIKLECFLSGNLQDYSLPTTSFRDLGVLGEMRIYS